MKMVRFISSGKMTLFLTALVSGIYLFLTFGNEDPFNRMVLLIRDNVIVKLIISFVYIHFFFKCVSKLSFGKKRQIPSALLALSIAIFIAGLFFSISFRDVKVQRMMEGEESGEIFRVSSIEMHMPDDLLVVGEKSEFRSGDITAIIENNGRRETLKPFPFTRIASVYAYVNDVGLSPEITSTVKGEGKTFQKLQLLPPNRKVSLPFTNGYKMEISLEPERKFKKGRLTAFQFNLQKPSYKIMVKYGQEVFFNKSVSDGYAGKMGDGEIRVGATKKWIEVVQVTDGALIFIYVGLLGMLFGILFYPLEFYLTFLR